MPSLGLSLAAAALLAAASATAQKYDAVVYGATPAGIHAACAAAHEGLKVALIHPLAHIGGVVASGLGKTDIGNAAVIGGSAHAFFVAIGEAYGVKGGAPMYTFEPHVAEAVFHAMLANTSGRVTLVTGQTLASVAKAGTVVTSMTTVPTAWAVALPTSQERTHFTELQAGGALPRAHADTPLSELHAAGAIPPALLTTYAGAVFLDASYEGDFIAAAGISFAWGREGAAQYNESLGGRLFEPCKVGGHQFGVPLNYTWPNGTLLPQIYTGEPGAVGEADQKVQAYNFRVCLTTNTSNWLPTPLPKPASYRDTDWELARRYFAIVGEGWTVGNVMNIGSMPHDKTDINNNGAISTDCIGCSWEWPLATPARRQAIWQAHADYTLSFFWFLANDPAVPASLAKSMRTLGLPADEFTDNGGFPWQLYVREGRRMVSDFVFTQNDREKLTPANNSIGLYSYNVDCHNAQRFPQGTFVRNEGDVEAFGNLGPGPMSYGLVLPRRQEATNVLAPVPTSATHLGYGAIRLEPQFMILGQSTGVAAAQAVAAGVAVQDVDIGKLQARLLELGQLLEWKA
jgi:hypothetical protein